MIMKRFLLIAAGAICFAGAAVFTGCGTAEKAGTNQSAEGQMPTKVPAEAVAENNGDAQAEENGVQEPLMGEFTTKTPEGEEVTQEIFAEKELSMVNIWGTFCGPCVREMPDLGELAREYEDKMQMIGIISDVGDVGNEEATEIVKLTKADYTHLINSVELMQGYMGTVQLIPTTVFLDKEGKQVGETYTGAKSKDQWAEIIEEMLAKVEERE